MSINWPSSPAEGDSYTYNGMVYRYLSGAWMPSPSGYSTIQQWSKTATAGQTAFTGADDLAVVLATNGAWTNVFLNGRILSPGLDYTLTPTTVTLLAAAKVGDTCAVVTITSGLLATTTQPNADNSLAPATTAFVHNYSWPLASVPVGRIKVTVFTSTGTFTPDANMVFGQSEVWGGGGSGASRNDGHPGGGGGGGGYSRKKFLPADIGASLTVTIGNGGAAPTINTLVDGAAGGTTTFGALHQATGGVGGSLQGSAAGGGAGSGGDLNLFGGSGFQFYTVITVFFTMGGSAAQGGGGAPAYTTGSVPGGGGGGGNNAAAPGAGGKGMCLVTEWLKP